MIKNKLERLKGDVINYSNLVQEMIDKSTDGLFEKNRDLINEVIDIDEPKANEQELKLEEVCTQLIARFQPKAKDLRTIMMVSKISNDLERIADLAVNVAKGSVYLIENEESIPLQKIRKMKIIVNRMLKETIQSFIYENGDLARKVCIDDSEVDELRDSILKDLITFILASEKQKGKLIVYLKISRKVERIASHFERIADHITNIAEDVVFMVEGKVIKHMGK